MTLQQIKFIFLMLFSITSIGIKAQESTTATLKDGNGIPIKNAEITIEETNDSIVSDDNGKFELSKELIIPFTLKINLAGYETQEYKVQSLDNPIEITLITLDDNFQLGDVVITARRRKETAQDVPIPISVIGGDLLYKTGAYNVNRVKELVPSVQLYSSNPRNTGLSIRGLGTTFGLTNDGIDPGVGFYVDGVYYARPAATTLDFIDVERIEVLRGPQGTLFGKNTTAGAFNITTRKPSFKNGAWIESSFGNYGFIQAKVSATGPINDKIAVRVSFSGTQRDGVLYNTRTQQKVNDQNNLGVRTQFLYNVNDKIDLTLAADYTRQRPNGYAQVIAGVAPTQRAAYRQFNSIIADLGYTLPSTNAFDRLIDQDTPWRSNQDLGGISLNANFKLWGGTLTSTSAWRFWNWDPSNDRDFTGLEALKLSQAPSKHQQWSQEVRWAGNLFKQVSAVFGVFAIAQDLKPDGSHTEESGKDQWRFSQSSTSTLWQTPGLLDGYGIKSYPFLKSFSGAIFGQIDWAINEHWNLLPGFRVNYDEKKVDFRRETYGGLQTDDPALIALQQSVYSNQEFHSKTDDTNFSGQLTLAFKPNKKINTFATVSTGFKPVGLNLGGLPTQNGQPMTELAVIKPERVTHYEVGIKTKPNYKSTVNFVIYNTDVKDYQTQVQTADLSVNRGYLANAEKVRVRGAELDASIRISNFMSIYGAVAYTEGIYKSFKNAPPPLEETGGATFKDISGSDLPGISKWAGSLGTEFTTKGRLIGKEGEFFLGVDSYVRSHFSSNPSPSKYLVVPGYALFNARLGFRASEEFSVFIWGRNVFNKDYYEQLLPGAGNAGQYAAVLGDPRTYGITFRYTIL